MISRARFKQLSAFIFGLIILPSFFVLIPHTYAQSEVDKLKEQITEREARLEEIEREIKKYESALNEVGAERETLEKAIYALELERKKVQADISYTENQISNTDLQINQLSIEIDDTLNDIDHRVSAIGEIIRTINTNDDESLMEILLRNDNLSDFWNEVDTLNQVKISIKKQAEQLQKEKDILENQKLTESEKKEQLLNLKEKYSGQKAVLENNKAQKDQLLTKTKNEEASYQSLLTQKKEAREKLLAEVRDIESQLQFILDPNSIPSAGDTVFRWPLENVVLTQYFGYTRFALSGAYNGSAHNGIDLGAPVGTSIYAPLSGTIRATGNTDTVSGCYSWGKWILIDHPNGLSTLFAHLSHIGVTSGQKIKTGDIVGYVGNTGYSTGPHLHYTLYVSEAVQVKQFSEFKSVTSCGSALSPFAAVEGYLNPLDYLPSP